MGRIERFAIGLAALVACGQSDLTVDERAEQLGQRAADKVQDVAQKTGADAKMMAHETAEEAKRVADKTADAAEHAGTQVAAGVDKAGDKLGNAAEQVSDIAADGIPSAAPPDEVRAVMAGFEAAIACDGAGKCTIAKDFAERLKARPDVVAAQAQCEAARDGAVVGMRIRSLGDLPRKLGFEPNDLLTTINGVALTSEAAVPELVLQLGKSQFQIKFVRKGSEHSLQIDVV